MPAYVTHEFALELDQHETPVETTAGGHNEPDPDWRHVDRAGHEHTTASEGATWRWVTTGGYYCEDCRDDHETGEYRCVVCGERVEPGKRWISDLGWTVVGPLRGTLRFADGRVYWLTPGELRTLRATPTIEWARAVAAGRAPDEWTVVM